MIMLNLDTRHAASYCLRTLVIEGLVFPGKSLVSNV